MFQSLDEVKFLNFFVLFDQHLKFVASLLLVKSASKEIHAVGGFTQLLKELSVIGLKLCSVDYGSDVLRKTPVVLVLPLLVAVG